MRVIPGALQAHFADSFVENFVETGYLERQLPDCALAACA